MGVVGSDGGDPGTPQQGEEPRRIDSVEVYTQVPGRIVPEEGQRSLAALLWKAGGACQTLSQPTQEEEHPLIARHFLSQPRRKVCLCPGGLHSQASLALLSVSHPTSKPCVPQLPAYSALCPHVLSGGLNWGIHSPSLLQDHL